MAAFLFVPKRRLKTLVDAVTAAIVAPIRSMAPAIQAAIDTIAFSIEATISPVALAIEAIGQAIMAGVVGAV